MSLQFNAPVPRRLAEQIRLTGARESIRPVIGEPSAQADAVVLGVSFAAPFGEQARFKLELPAGFRDASGRTLRRNA